MKCCCVAAEVRSSSAPHDEPSRKISSSTGERHSPAGPRQLLHNLLRICDECVFPDVHVFSDLAVSWVTMVTEKVSSVLSSNDTRSLNTLLLFYVIL